MRKCYLLSNPQSGFPIKLREFLKEDINTNDKNIVFLPCNYINNLNNKYFFDVILNPTETLFLSRANEKNAKICSGLYMMIFQLVDLFCETNNVDCSKINIEDLYQQLK